MLNVVIQKSDMDFAAGVLSVWDPLPSYNPILPSYTLSKYIQYTYSHREGGWGG